MTFSHDSLLAIVLRLARGLALAWVLTAQPSGASALNSPQRSATLIPIKSTAEYNSGRDHDRGPHTYLAMIGPAPLCFGPGQRQLPPEPTMPTPTQPQEAAKPTPLAQTQAVAPEVAIKPGESVPDNAEHVAELTPGTAKPVSILPDDTRIEISPEDVLPFFQFPGAPEGGTTIAPPSPAQPRGANAPLSSATYKQQ